MPADVTTETYRRLHAFRSGLRRFIREVDAAIREEGLEPQQYQLLLMLKGLSADRPRTIRTVAEELLIRHHSAVELVDRLEQKGLVERTRSGSDRREVVLHLTSAGEATLGRLATFAQHELTIIAPQLIETLSAILNEDGTGPDR